MVIYGYGHLWCRRRPCITQKLRSNARRVLDSLKLWNSCAAAEAAAAAAVAAEGMAVKEGLSEQLEQGAQAAADIAEESCR